MVSQFPYVFFFADSTGTDPLRCEALALETSTDFDPAEWEALAVKFEQAGRVAGAARLRDRADHLADVTIAFQQVQA